MKKKWIAVFLVGILILSVAAMGTGCGKSSDSSKEKSRSAATGETSTLAIAAGPADGLYYAIAEALSAAIAKGMGYNVQVIETTGSFENVKLLAEGKADLAISMLDMATHKYKGTGIFQGGEGSKDLRLLMDLYPSYIQIVTTENSGITEFQSLKYKKVGIDVENAGTEWDAKQILGAYGMTYEDCLVQQVDTKTAIEKVNNGDLDVAMIIGGIPNGMIGEMERDKGKQLVLVPLSGAENKKITDQSSFWKKATIPNHTYGKQKEVETLSMLNVLMASNSLSEKTVEALMDCISHNIVQIQAMDKILEN
ncbi:MAG: TAXI family TRAP transporter solute-binding subunit, partial [Anaerovorax sp.]